MVVGGGQWWLRLVEIGLYGWAVMDMNQSTCTTLEHTQYRVRVWNVPPLHFFDLYHLQRRMKDEGSHFFYRGY